MGRKKTANMLGFALTRHISFFRSSCVFFPHPLSQTNMAENTHAIPFASIQTTAETEKELRENDMTR